MKQKKIEKIETMFRTTKRRFYGMLKLVVFLLILFICLNILNNITKRKYAYQKTADFFSQQEDFNVLLFGSSHMMNSIFPMKLWNDYGIVSYNMGNYSETMATSYYNMLLALKETKPKLIVIDAYGCCYENNKVHDEKLVRNMFETYYASYTKYYAIKDLFEGKDILIKEIEYLFDFPMYHTRWNEIKKNDFIYDKKYEKGASSLIKIADFKTITNFNLVEEYDKEENTNMKYLRKIIEYGKKNDIEILVTCNPYFASDEQMSIFKYVEHICSEYEVNYINFFNLEVTNNTDYYDNGHLNVSGARKVTDYLGKYIMENYNIPDQRENEAYSFWYEDYDEYIDLKIENLEKNKKNLNNYLMLLYDEEDIKYEIKISSKRKIEEGTTLYELLKNIDNNYQIDDTAFEENKNKTIKITTWDNRTGEEIDTVWF